MCIEWLLIYVAVHSTGNLLALDELSNWMTFKLAELSTG